MCEKSLNTVNGKVIYTVKILNYGDNFSIINARINDPDMKKICKNDHAAWNVHPTVIQYDYDLRAPVYKITIEG